MNIKLSKLRVSALAAATALALAAPIASAAGLVNVSGLESSQTNDRFIVKYRSGSTERSNVANAKATLARFSGVNIGGKALPVNFMRRLAVGAEVVQVGRKLDRVDAESFMRQLAANPNVEYVEADQRMYAAVTPNDTRYADQWHYSEATGGIKANEAWDTTTGSGVVVAVIDTGITPHSDLNDNILAGYDFISDSAVANDGNGRDSNPNDPGDSNGSSSSSWHGTHVAGTIGAVTNNSKGVAGVAYGAKIVPVRVLGKGGGSLSDISDAIIWASGGNVSGVPNNANPAEVINMSLGGSGSCSSTYQSAINGAVQRGTTVVVAAGNSSANVSGFQPANCSNVIAVASTDRQGARSSFSNYGAGIDVSAPGSSILSTHNGGSQSQGSESYSLMSGTSMASPHVAGVVALIQAAAGSSPKTPAQVETILKDTARALPGSCSGGCGAGIINAKAAIGGGSDPDPDPDPQPGSLTNGTAVTGLSGNAGAALRYTLVVPSGASALKFLTASGSGDADLYVKFGSAPSTTSNDCKSEGSSNAETCNIPTAQAGTYHVLVYGYANFSGLSLTGSYTTGDTGGTQTYANTADYTINDNATVDSPVTVSGRSGNAPNNATVAVNILHTYIGDLKVDLVAPDGSLYNLHNRTGAGADNINKSYTVNLSTEALNGTWKLRVNDNAANDIGKIDSWSVKF